MLFLKYFNSTNTNRPSSKDWSGLRRPGTTISLSGIPLWYKPPAMFSERKCASLRAGLTVLSQKTVSGFGATWYLDWTFRCVLFKLLTQLSESLSRYICADLGTGKQHRDVVIKTRYVNLKDFEQGILSGLRVLKRLNETSSRAFSDPDQGLQRFQHFRLTDNGVIKFWFSHFRVCISSC